MLEPLQFTALSLTFLELLIISLIFKKKKNFLSPTSLYKVDHWMKRESLNFIWLLLYMLTFISRSSFSRKKVLKCFLSVPTWCNTVRWKLKSWEIEIHVTHHNVHNNSSFQSVTKCHSSVRNMASFLSEEQFQCSICLESFKNPVSIPCGHNFCLECIKHYWDVVHKSDCPLCKETFRHRPELRINVGLKDITETFQRLVDFVNISVLFECFSQCKWS